MSRTLLPSSNVQVVLIALMVLLCCCLALVGFGLIIWSTTISETASVSLVTVLPTLTPFPSRTSNIAPIHTPTRTLSPTPQSTAVVTPTPADPIPSPTPERGAPTTEERVLTTEMPQRDIRLLAERLKKTGPIPEVVHESPPVYELGDETEFWVGNVDTMEQFRITAVLRYVTPHLYVWVEKGLSYDRSALARSAENFESRIYGKNRAFFGSEWSPGVDNDVHLHILHSTGKHMGSSVAGYYSSADEYSQLANPYSNEREMFYLSLGGSMTPGTDFYDGVLAHEFQHMIHWANDRNEETWVNEGCSELAAYLNGYDPGGFDWSFISAPDVQLTTWPEIEDAASHYGNSYLFMAYFLGRFGEEAMKRVVADPANGISGFDAVLGDYRLTFEKVFADWLVANYVDDAADDGLQIEPRYTYPDHRVGPTSIDISHDDYPAHRSSTVHQYAADYVELRGKGDLVIEFAGDTEARLVPEGAHSGQYAWWSNRGDDSDAVLTRAFDLRAVQRATLQAWMWHDIEKDWDYAYVEVSTDDGRTWDILTGPSTTTSNPNGNSFGAAYTGVSGGWVQETFDLSPYVGRKVLIRFEYVTDDAVNGAGWLIDDIRIPELGYSEDFESGTGEWNSEGFVYSDNRVSQRYLVQLIVFDGQRGARAGEIRVLRMPLDETQRGRVELNGLGKESNSAVLVVSALASMTTEVAAYEYTIQPIQRSLMPKEDAHTTSTALPEKQFVALGDLTVVRGE